MVAKMVVAMELLKAAKMVDVTADTKVEQSVYLMGRQLAVRKVWLMDGQMDHRWVDRLVEMMVCLKGSQKVVY